MNLNSKELKTKAFEGMVGFFIFGQESEAKAALVAARSHLDGSLPEGEYEYWNRKLDKPFPYGRRPTY